MNDFTKNELENLREACNFFPRDSFYHGEHVADLRDKLRNMIDNYCEHEFIGYMDGVAAIPYCNKCGRTC